MTAPSILSIVLMSVFLLVSFFNMNNQERLSFIKVAIKISIGVSVLASFLIIGKGLRAGKIQTELSQESFSQITSYASTELFSENQSTIINNPESKVSEKQKGILKIVLFILAFLSWLKFFESPIKKEDDKITKFDMISSMAGNYYFILAAILTFSCLKINDIIYIIGL